MRLLPATASPMPPYDYSRTIGRLGLLTLATEQLLGRFEEWLDKEEGGGAVVGFDGFAAYASVRSLLNSLCDEVRGDEVVGHHHVTLAMFFFRHFARRPRFPRLGKTMMHRSSS